MTAAISSLPSLQVDQAMLEATQTSNARYYLFEYIKDVQAVFGLDWPSLEWEELRKPLVSGLAARMYIQWSGRRENNDLPRSIEKQAEFWEQHYRPGGDVDNFITESNRLEQGRGEEAETWQTHP